MVVAVELSRLLRRGLLVAAVAVAGWLLGVLFAGPASAQPLPPQDQQQTHDRQPGGGLLGGLLSGVTGALAGLTETVVDTTTGLLTPVVLPMPDHDVHPPIVPTAPSGGSSAGTATTARAETPPPVVEAPPVAPAAPVVVAPPRQPVVVVSVPKPVTRQVVVPVAPPAPVVQETADSTAAEHAGRGDPVPQPVKAPAAPAGSGATVSSAHDSSGHARGTHGVLGTQTTLHSADAGFTTRSRAVDAAGRAAGLPASSPD